MKMSKGKWKIVTIMSVVIVLVLIFVGGYYWYSQVKIPHDNAVAEFRKAKKIVEAENKTLDKVLSDSQKILDDNIVAYDESVYMKLQTAISSCKESKREILSLPKKTADIIIASNKLKEPLDYSNEIKLLETQQLNVKNSVKQYQQISNPTGDFVVLRLNEIESIENIQVVTEENDPNGNLNKQGGYTSAVYFSSINVDQAEVFGDSLIDKGTDAGGCIEVYSTLEDAEKRNSYLSAFDGGVLSSGSHSVVGTVVVRTSSKLTASNQTKLDEEIVEKLIELK